MPDITMCNGQGCPIKDECYRFKAEPDRYQSYFSIPPYDSNHCSYYQQTRDSYNRLKLWVTAPGIYFDVDLDKIILVEHTEPESFHRKITEEDNSYTGFLVNRPSIFYIGSL